MEEKHVKSYRQKMDRGILFGVVSIIINLITVSVYIYQAQLMQEQQQASV